MAILNWDYAQQHQVLWLVWTALALTGVACAGAVRTLACAGRLTAPPVQPALALAGPRPTSRAGLPER
ncbi:hypothetical protein [Streptomyces sp. NPDC088348]|uniref:hypothetical protein n=1 Tax=Streptomyces sp. NPDC088348 TaxID=3365853 RepID=UPI0038005389